MKIYKPSEYNADNQNWSITQDENGFIYTANNKGILSFNGANWKLNYTPNNSITRCVKAIGNRIYIGYYMGIGYFQFNEYGDLIYYDLSKLLKNNFQQDEEFWQIKSFQNQILFKSINRILFFNPKTEKFEVFNSEEEINCIAIVNNKIFIHINNEGIFTLENGKKQQYNTSNIFKKNKIINIIESQNKLIAASENNGLFEIDNSKTVPFSSNSLSKLKKCIIYSFIKLSNGMFAIGTISKGLLLFSKDGKLELNIKRSNGLSNNTVLSLFQDGNNSLWIGTDYGINYMDLDANIKIFYDKQGELGTVYDASLYQGNLYLGTNQGLFYKKNATKDAFKMVENTEGQVWSLFIHDNILFCAHHKGTFIIDNKKAKNIYDETGTWVFKVFKGRKNTLFQGNYNGIKVLKKKNNQWQFSHAIEGFDFSCQFFEISKDKIYVNHEYKGVFELTPNKGFTKFENYKKLSTFQTSQSSGLVSYNKDIYYLSQEGMYVLKNTQNSFQKDSLASSILHNQLISGRATVDNDDNSLWVFSKKGLLNINIGQLYNGHEFNLYPFPVSYFTSVVGFQKIKKIDIHKYLIGFYNGYVVYNTNQKKRKKAKMFLNTIKSENKKFKINEEDEITLNYKNNTIQFEFSIPDYDANYKTQYQTKLISDLDSQWTDWEYKPSKKYENLPSGKYKFEIKAKVGNRITSNSKTYNFTVLKPWFLSYLAIIIYCILAIGLFTIIHTLYKQYFKRQKQRIFEENEEKLAFNKIASQKKIIQLENEKLETELEGKNREKAILTMSLIKKNKILNGIKRELKPLKKNIELKSILKIIDKELNNNNDWTFFKEAFDNVDQDFFKKIKKLHPQLTPNDLRLCVYLRLNLSSKEIAPLFNISARSVEVKRYRLRKKINLLHDNNLVDYILEL